MAELGGSELSGIGFGLGVDRMLLACEAEGLTPFSARILDVFIVPVGDQSRGPAVSLLNALRAAGIATDVCVDNRSIKSAMKAANSTNAPLVIILGPDELSSSSVLVKNMSSGEQHSLSGDHGTLIPAMQETLRNLPAETRKEDQS
jgi:histidyl-tRNA synthetase